MRGSRKLCHRGSNSNSNNGLLADEGREDANTTENGPSLASQRSAIDISNGQTWFVELKVTCFKFQIRNRGFNNETKIT